MTSIRSCSTATAGPEERPLRERRKAVLTCPDCPHTSCIDGDWLWIPTSDGIELRCPNCSALLTVRSHREGGPVHSQTKERSD